MHLVTQVEAAAFLYYEIQLVKNILLYKDNSVGSLLNSDSPFFIVRLRGLRMGKTHLRLRELKLHQSG